MNSRPKPVLVGAAEWLLQKLIVVWPQESRPWGIALAAELAELETSWASLRWSIGGLTFFLRSVASHFASWMCLPAGAGLVRRTTTTGDALPPTPKHSRLLTMALLCAAATLCILPQGREAATAVRASWSCGGIAGSEKRAIENLAARAIREHDANLLAFAAIAYPEPEKSEKWAEQAVAMDTSLSWIYATHATWGIRWEIPETHLRALREFDPDNSFVYLLSADRIYRNEIFPLYDHGSPSQQQIGQLLADDPQWAMWMEKALQSVRYDNYRQKRYELQSRVWREYPYLSPDVIAQSIQSQAWPDFGNLTAFTALRVQAAEQSHRAGNDAAAERSLKELAASCDRFAEGRQQDFLLWGFQIVRRISLNALETLYASTGRTTEAAAVSARIAESAKLRNSRSALYGRALDAVAATYRWRAYSVQLSALALLLFAIASALSLVVLEIAARFPKGKFGPAHRILSFTADYGPIVLLLASASFFLGYRPFAHAFAGFRSGELPLTNQAGLLFLLDSLRLTSPSQFGAGETYRLWWTITLLLSGLALFPLIRPFFKRRPES